MIVSVIALYTAIISIKAFEDTSVKTDHRMKSREVTLAFW